MTDTDKLIEGILGKVKKPTDKQMSDRIVKIFGPGSKILGIDNRINFNQVEFDHFFKSLNKSKKKELVEIVFFYSDHIDRLSFLLKESGNYKSFLNKRVWSTVSILLIISVLEKITRQNTLKQRPEPFQYIKENFKKVEKNKDIERLKQEYYKKYPGKGRQITKLLEENLDDSEIDRIISGYRNRRQEKGGLKIETLQDVVDDLYGRSRSGFVHNAKEDPIDDDPFWVDIKEVKGRSGMVIYPNLSVKSLLYYFWLAIFRSFGFDGEMDDLFGEDELEKGFTVDGTKIRF